MTFQNLWIHLYTPMDHQTLVTHQYPVVALQNLETQPTSWRFLYRSMASSTGGGREGLKSGGALDLFRRTTPTTSYLRQACSKL